MSDNIEPTKEELKAANVIGKTVGDFKISDVTIAQVIAKHTRYLCADGVWRDAATLAGIVDVLKAKCGNAVEFAEILHKKGLAWANKLPKEEYREIVSASMLAGLWLDGQSEVPVSILTDQATKMLTHSMHGYMREVVAERTRAESAESSLAKAQDKLRDVSYYLYARNLGQPAADLHTEILALLPARQSPSPADTKEEGKA